MRSLKYLAPEDLRMELFGTAGIRGPAQSEVTPALVVSLGRAAAEDGTEFVIGRDGRETGQTLSFALNAGLQSGGADVIQLGQVPTPALAFASRGRRGIMITASHNPPADNGLKFFVDGAEYDRNAERRLESRLESEISPIGWDQWGARTSGVVLETYRAAVSSYVREKAGICDGVRVAVDCGNGVSSLVTPQILEELGATVRTLNANIDGHFPGRESKPTPETLRDLSAFVADGPFDLGIGHDGDGDRIVVIDSSGEVVHEDTVLAIIARQYTKTSNAIEPTVITTPNASGRIDEQVEAAGGWVRRVPLGGLHEGITAIEDQTDSDATIVFAAEPWKHLHTDFGAWIDATVSAGMITALVGKHGFAALRESITERPYRKINVECPDEHKLAVMGALQSRLAETFSEADIETEYGVRLSFSDNSWVLVRPSGTEPYIRVYAESDTVEQLVGTVRQTIERAIAETH